MHALKWRDAVEFVAENRSIALMANTFAHYKLWCGFRRATLILLIYFQVAHANSHEPRWKCSAHSSQLCRGTILFSERTPARRGERAPVQDLVEDGLHAPW